MILVFGASYAIVIPTKLMLASYDVVCVYKFNEPKIINNERFFLDIPRYLNKNLKISFKNLPRIILAAIPEDIELKIYKLKEIVKNFDQKI